MSTADSSCIKHSQRHTLHCDDWHTPSICPAVCAFTYSLHDEYLHFCTWEIARPLQNTRHHPSWQLIALNAVVLHVMQGEMVCCDGCRAIYHLGCIGLPQLPEGDWYCPLCLCSSCHQPCTTPAANFTTHPELLPVTPVQLQASNSNLRLAVHSCYVRLITSECVSISCGLYCLLNRPCTTHVFTHAAALVPSYPTILLTL